MSLRRASPWIALLLVLVLSPEASAEQGATPIYMWTVSGSDTDPRNDTGPSFPGGERTLYLWMYCRYPENAPGIGGASISLDIFGATALSFDPRPGVTNSGSASDLDLSVEGCPTGAHLMGALRIDTPSGGFDICLSAPLASSPCDGSPTAEPSAFIGYSTLSPEGCSFDLEYYEYCLDVTSVAPRSWGRAKALYRP
ncbi:MAG: hypothetical protein R3B81_15055 [bacterium]